MLVKLRKVLCLSNSFGGTYAFLYVFQIPSVGPMRFMFVKRSVMIT